MRSIPGKPAGAQEKNKDAGSQKAAHKSYSALSPKVAGWVKHNLFTKPRAQSGRPIVMQIVFTEFR